jgi:cytidylate kinase
VGDVARPLIVAIDGPAGAGKSSVSKLLATRLGFALVDTGAIYRCVALRALRAGVALDDDAGLEALLPSLRIAFHMSGGNNQVLLDGEDVSDEIRTPENSMAASRVSRRAVVRAGLLGLQRRLALEAGQGAILEGRDIGTVVFPDADLKVFLFADPGVRAQRRFEELSLKGVEKPVEAVLNEQNRRDREDTDREVAPLMAAADAVKLDSTAMPLEEVVRRIELLVRGLPRP